MINSLITQIITDESDEQFYKNCLITSRMYLRPDARVTLVVAGGLRYTILLNSEDTDFTNRILTDLNRIEKSNGNSNTWITKLAAMPDSLSGDFVKGLVILCSTLSAEEVIDSVTESLCKKCKRCGSTNLVKCGLTKFKKQRWLCRGCGRKQNIAISCHPTLADQVYPRR